MGQGGGGGGVVDPETRLLWTILNLLNLHNKFTGNKPWTSRGKLNCSVCYAPIHFITFRIDVRELFHTKKRILLF